MNTVSTRLISWVMASHVTHTNAMMRVYETSQQKNLKEVGYNHRNRRAVVRHMSLYNKERFWIRTQSMLLLSTDQKQCPSAKLHVTSVPMPPDMLLSICNVLPSTMPV
jgi:hypothetical protein